jgi:hypothetical protein
VHDGHPSQQGGSRKEDDSLCAALEAGTTADAGDGSIEATSNTAGDASAE